MVQKIRHSEAPSIRADSASSAGALEKELAVQEATERRGQVRDDQAGPGVHPPEGGEDLHHRDQHNGERDHQAGEHAVEEDAPAGEVEHRKGIAGDHPGGDLAGRGDDGEDGGVDVEPAERGRVPGDGNVRPLPMCRDDRRVRVDDVGLRLQRREEHPQQRKHDAERRNSDDHIDDDAHRPGDVHQMTDREARPTTATWATVTRMEIRNRITAIASAAPIDPPAPSPNAWLYT